MNKKKIQKTVLSIRITPAEKRKLMMIAKKTGKTLSQVWRELYLRR